MKLILKSILAVTCLMGVMPLMAQEHKDLEPLTERVNVQADTARMSQIIDGRWVAVGIQKPTAIQRDYTRLYKGEPSVRFTLGLEDNTLQGYSKGETKGRAEFSYCYATAKDFEGISSEQYAKEQLIKTVYHRGKGINPQGSKWHYRFSIYVPEDLSPEVSTIFAQWHGMPDRTLTTMPSGEVRRLTIDEFIKMLDSVIIKKDTAYEQVTYTTKNGKQRTKRGEPTGWKVEQGGYPPLAFGFQGGWFYIKANSDRRWFSDKTDRCNASASKYDTMQAQSSEYKTSTIAFRMPFEKFPKNIWVNFDVDIDWTKYSGESEEILSLGRLHVVMNYQRRHMTVTIPIVNNLRLPIGRNDQDGYYFKYGIYRVGGSNEPVSYNLAGFSQEER